MGHENPAERAEGLTDEQRLHLAQAANLLQEYGAECSRSGTDSTAEGCNASAYVLRQMLAETARIERESRASAGPDALQRVRDYVMGRKGIQSKFGGQTYTYVMREDVIDAIDDAARGIGVRSTETREGLGPQGVEPGPEVAPREGWQENSPNTWRFTDLGARSPAPAPAEPTTLASLRGMARDNLAGRTSEEVVEASRAEWEAPQAAAPAPDMPRVVKTAPESIYLVIGEDCPEDEDFGNLVDHEVTWCADKIDSNSIKYVRADLASQHPTEE
jgi:hypothetical protein